VTKEASSASAPRSARSPRRSPLADGPAAHRLLPGHRSRRVRPLSSRSRRRIRRMGSVSSRLRRRIRRMGSVSSRLRRRIRRVRSVSSRLRDRIRRARSVSSRSRRRFRRARSVSSRPGHRIRCARSVSSHFSLLFDRRSARKTSQARCHCRRSLIEWPPARWDGLPPRRCPGRDSAQGAMRRPPDTSFLRSTPYEA